MRIQEGEETSGQCVCTSIPEVNPVKYSPLDLSIHAHILGFNVAAS